MDKDPRLYNSRLLNIYTKLLRDKYPDVSLSDILAYSRIEPYEITDEGCWLTQIQIDRFYERAVQLTGNPGIAREAGRLAASPGTIGALRQHTFGLLGPALAFQVINRLSKRLTHSGDYQSRALHSHKVEITVKPYRNVEEKPFQCENRKGFFEAIVEGFHLARPHIEHPECLFNGGNCCRYIISWKPNFSSFLRPVRNIFFVLLFLSVIPGYSIFTAETFLITFLSVLFSLMGISLLCELVQRKQMVRSMENLWDSSERLNDLIDSSARNIQLIDEIGQALVNKHSVEDVLSTVTEVMKSGLDFDSGAILLANSQKTRLMIRGTFGYSPQEMKRFIATDFNLNNSRSQGPLVISFRERKPFIVDNTEELKSQISERSRKLIEMLDIHSFLCCPIVIDEEAIGVIAVTNKTLQRPLIRSDVNLLQGIAPTIGVAIQNAGLIDEIRDSFERTLKVLAASIDARDYLTAGHSEVVTEYATIIAKELGMSEDFIQMIRIASLLHDYGKIAIPDDILKKDGRLTEEERDIINTHPVRTRQILSQVPFRGSHTQIPAIAGAHHERWDGMGYPNGLAGSDIPLGARIIAVADFFEAITAKRHYREPMPLKVALKLLEESSGSHFDPKIVAVFMMHLEKNNFILPTSTSRDNGAHTETYMPERQSPRVDYRTQVSIKYQQRVLAGDTCDLSSMGAYIACSDSLRIGAKVKLTFTPPGGSCFVQVSGTVVWIDNKVALSGSLHPKGFSVHFTKISADVQGLINEFINRQITPLVSPDKKKVTYLGQK